MKKQKYNVRILAKTFLLCRFCVESENKQDAYNKAREYADKKFKGQWSALSIDLFGNF